MRKYQLLIVALVVSLDALTKWLVRSRIPFESEIDVIPGFFRLTHLKNTGAAFSMFADSGPGAAVALVVFSCAAVVVVAYLLWKSGDVLNATTVAFALIGSGAFGNLWERALRGGVTDFLDFYIGRQHWPPFNLADSAICVGAIILLTTIVFGKSPQEETS
jgi:signal peptidase II